MTNIVERIGVMIEESWLVTFAAIAIVILFAVIIYKLFINKILSVVVGGNPLPLGGGRSLVNS